MTLSRRIDVVAACLAAAIWLRAAVVGLPRLDGLLHPVGLPREVGHAWVALAGFGLVPVLALGAWASRERLARVDVLSRLSRRPGAVLGRDVAALLLLVAVLAPLLTEHLTGATVHRPSLPPAPGRWFGSDEVGADVFARVLFGARVSLGVGAIAVVLSATVGGAVGAAAGFFGGWLDRVLMGLTDLLLSLPRLALLLLVIGLSRPDAGRFFVVAAVLGLTGWMGVARIVRSQVLSVRELEYVQAARAMGLGEGAILTRHVLPNVAAPIVVFATLALGDTLLAEAALAFLGRGASTDVSWGGLVAGLGVSRMRDAPWVGVFPGLAILVTVMAFNLFGDGLRDALDPRRRGRP